MKAQVLPIEQGEPVPVEAQRIDFRGMAVGASTFVPGASIVPISGRCWRAKRDGLGRFKSRTMVKDGVAGVRVWRIE